MASSDCRHVGTEYDVVKGGVALVTLNLAKDNVEEVYGLGAALLVEDEDSWARPAFQREVNPCVSGSDNSIIVKTYS